MDVRLFIFSMNRISIAKEKRFFFFLIHKYLNFFVNVIQVVLEWPLGIHWTRSRYPSDQYYISKVIPEGNLLLNWFYVWPQQVRLQTQDARNPTYRGTFHCLQTIVQQESVWTWIVIIYWHLSNFVHDNSNKFKNTSSLIVLAAIHFILL